MGIKKAPLQSALFNEITCLEFRIDANAQDSVVQYITFCRNAY